MAISKTPVRWVHISDFHVGRDDYGELILFTCLLDDIKKRVDANICPDMVFITGDLAYSGTQQQYTNLFLDFYIPLWEILSNYWKEPAENRIFIVPGNHDVDQNKARAVKTHGVLKEVVTFLDPTVAGLTERSPLFPRFDAFIHNEKSCKPGEEHWMSSKDGFLTRIIDINGWSIGILLINTAWLSNEKDDRHNLSPGIQILKSGLLNISGADLQIVVGHHPVDWFIDSEVLPIRALFAKNKVIYLHGHLHKNIGRQEPGAGETFLAIQSGAAFQTRESEKWINGYLWCEANIEEGYILLEPRIWSRDNQEWTVDCAALPQNRRNSGTDTWSYPLPGHMEPSIISPTDLVCSPVKRSYKDIRKVLPLGWQLITPEYLETQSIPLSNEQVVTFFDGRVPSWAEALSPLIPKRAIVNKLATRILGDKEIDGIKITLLEGAGGEGKSTILRQTICKIIETDPKQKIIWHNGSGNNFPDLDTLYKDTDKWIIASDDADQISKTLFEAIQCYKAGSGPNINILLTCRDTDWLATESERLPWEQHAIYKKSLLRGISEEDARIIVTGWRRLGEPGMGKLFNRSDEEAAKELFDAARSEYGSSEGAFLGAMLRIRIGENLKSHVEKILLRLNKREAPGGSLLRAFAYIAAPHSENILSLSKMILARTLPCQMKDVKSLVIGPLGQEAAVSTAGQFILTRHRAIAEAAVEIMSSQFHIDIDEIFIDLAASAYDLFSERTYVERLPDWLYLSNNFSNKNNDLAIRLAKMALDKERDNPFLIVNYAKALRYGNYQREAVKFFRESPDYTEKDRTFYTEWGIAESQDDNDGVAVWLAGISIADNFIKKKVRNNDASHGLSIIAASTLNMFNKYNNPLFRDVCRSACLIGLCLPDIKDRARELFIERLNQSTLPEDLTWDLSTSVEVLLKGIMEIGKFCEDELPDSIPKTTTLNFTSFRSLVNYLKPKGMTVA